MNLLCAGQVAWFNCRRQNSAPIGRGRTRRLPHRAQRATEGEGGRGCPTKFNQFSPFAPQQWSLGPIVINLPEPLTRLATEAHANCACNAYERAQFCDICSSTGSLRIPNEHLMPPPAIFCAKYLSHRAVLTLGADYANAQCPTYMFAGAPPSHCALLRGLHQAAAVHDCHRVFAGRLACGRFQVRFCGIPSSNALKHGMPGMSWVEFETLISERPWSLMLAGV